MDNLSGTSIAYKEAFSKNGKSNVNFQVETKSLIKDSNLILNKLFKISVIIPVYQEEKIIEKTLLTYTPDLRKKFNIEVIVSDGGSTDTTLAIAEKYADIIVTHKSGVRQTISDGRNKGADAASGDILVFINGDTVPQNSDDFFQNILEWGNGKGSNASSSALACPVTVAPDEKIFKDKIFYTLHNFYVKLLNAVGIGMGRGECQIIKTEYFRKVNGYNPNIAAGEDFDLYRRIGKIGKISFHKKLWVYESPRRFRRYGYLKIVFSWTINSLAVMLYGKSVSDEWEAVR